MKVPLIFNSVSDHCQGRAQEARADAWPLTQSLDLIQEAQALSSLAIVLQCVLQWVCQCSIRFRFCFRWRNGIFVYLSFFNIFFVLVSFLYYLFSISFLPLKIISIKFVLSTPVPPKQLSRQTSPMCPEVVNFALAANVRKVIEPMEGPNILDVDHG